DTLKQMGMPLAFSNDADFSGMDGTKNLFIAAVIHQAFVEVNEEGTEAAAATAVVVNLKSALPQVPVFYADHPFVFLIQERKTGNILFLGRVSDPTK
ncbi:MAG: serpin family protein, partial [Candidatus Aenigmarchaeota archaeon]|nr:serpin family protein [Candidatus Aenigmarchaeota archaeon]